MSESILSDKIEATRKSAKKKGGVCTHEYSQSLEPIRSWLGYDERTKAGACRQFVIRWIKDVVAPDPTYWSCAVDKKGRPDSSFVGNIMIQCITPGKINLNPEGELKSKDEDDAYFFPNIDVGWLRVNNELQHQYRRTYRNQRFGSCGKPYRNPFPVRY